jgi:hypothetical protein
VTDSTAGDDAGPADTSRSEFSLPWLRIGRGNVGRAGASLNSLETSLFPRFQQPIPILVGLDSGPHGANLQPLPPSTARILHKMNRSAFCRDYCTVVWTVIPFRTFVAR